MKRLLALTATFTLAAFTLDAHAQEDYDDDFDQEIEVEIEEEEEPEVLPPPFIEPPEPTISDLASIAVHGGAFFPAADIGGGTFETSGTVGGTVTLWLDGLVPDSVRGLTDLIGLRGSFLFAQTDVGGLVPAPLLGADPDVWLLNGDLVLRYPVDLPAGWVVPYALGGLGAKIYDFDVGTETDFAGNFGAGVEYRFGRNFGIGTELRAFVSEFDRFGVADTQWDLVWTGMLSASF